MTSAQMVRYTGLLTEKIAGIDEFTAIRNACESVFTNEHAPLGAAISDSVVVRNQRTVDGTMIEVSRWKYGRASDWRTKPGESPNIRATKFTQNHDSSLRRKSRSIVVHDSRP